MRKIQKNKNQDSLRRFHAIGLVQIAHDYLQNSFGAAVGQPYWIGEEHSNHPQTTTVAELSTIENPHEAEACFLPHNSFVAFPDFSAFIL